MRLELLDGIRKTAISNMLLFPAAGLALGAPVGAAVDAKNRLRGALTGGGMGGLAGLISAVSLHSDTKLRNIEKQLDEAARKMALRFYLQ